MHGDDGGLQILGIYNAGSRVVLQGAGSVNRLTPIGLGACAALGPA